MKIYIIGSMVFANEMMETKQKLDLLGHDAKVPPDTKLFIETGMTTDNHEEDMKHCIENDIMRESFRHIERSDGILVLNHSKNGIDGYIGTATLMEIGLAYHLGKKIFLLNDPPELKNARYTHEISIIDPKVLNNDLTKINEHSNPKIILATTSPFRKEFFRNLGLDFTAEGSDVDENFNGRPEIAEELVKELAKRKAESVAKSHESGIIIGFDSVTEFNGNILEKPESREEAFERIKSFSGNSHSFFTGINMINLETGQSLSKVVKTDIQLRDLTDSEINKYLDQDERKIYMKTALGYDSFSMFSSSFAKCVNGDHLSYLQGTPTATIMEMLFELGYSI